jgi:hypothetical protein
MLLLISHGGVRLLWLVTVSGPMLKILRDDTRFQAELWPARPKGQGQR